MKIRVTYDCPPIGTRTMDWSAIDDSTYDGQETDPVGYGATRTAAILQLIDQMEITPEIPSEGLCSAVNPSLWSAFCTLKNRPADPSFVWSEADVIQALDMEWDNAHVVA